jgi:hypothetical protein
MEAMPNILLHRSTQLSTSRKGPTSRVRRVAFGTDNKTKAQALLTSPTEAATIPLPAITAAVGLFLRRPARPLDSGDGADASDHIRLLLSRWCVRRPVSQS